MKNRPQGKTFTEIMRTVQSSEFKVQSWKNNPEPETRNPE